MTTTTATITTTTNMEVISRLIAETRRLAHEAEEIEKESTILQSAILIEEQNLSSLKKDEASIVTQSANIDATTKHQSTFQNLSRRFFLVNKFLEKFVENTEPTDAQQMSKLTSLRDNYEKMLKEYEDSPTYQAILREEAAEMEMVRLIQEKNNEMMRLETERDFTS